MDRDRCAERIHAGMPDSALVVGGIGTAGRAWRERGASQLTYFPSEPMGAHMAMAAGLALARRDELVFYFGGDGDLLLSLSTLVTVAGSGASNLRLVIFSNGRYETGGGQPLPGGRGLDLAAVARGVGIPLVLDCPTEAVLADAMPTFIGGPGPALLLCHTDPGPSPYPVAGEWAPVEERAFFMRQLRQRARKG